MASTICRAHHPTSSSSMRPVSSPGSGSISHSRSHSEPHGAKDVTRWREVGDWNDAVNVGAGDVTDARPWICRSSERFSCCNVNEGARGRTYTTSTHDHRLLNRFHGVHLAIEFTPHGIDLIVSLHAHIESSQLQTAPRPLDRGHQSRSSSDGGSRHAAKLSSLDKQHNIDLTVLVKQLRLAPRRRPSLEEKRIQFTPPLV